MNTESIRRGVVVGKEFLQEVVGMDLFTPLPAVFSWLYRIGVCPRRECALFDFLSVKCCEQGNAVELGKQKFIHATFVARYPKFSMMFGCV
jgi:hypothetical protein